MRQKNRYPLCVARIGMILALGMLGLSGCGMKPSSGTTASSMNTAMNSMSNMNAIASMAKVHLTIPKDTYVGTDNTFSVKVTQSGKPVNNADEVLFEIWENKTSAKHELIRAKLTGDGVYSIEYTFSKPGSYNVMYHVVAFSNMIMTAPQLVIVRK